MPVVTIKSKARSSAAAAATALSNQIQKKTADLLDAADRVLVVYEPTGANIYYEGAGKPGGHGAN